jgi:flagellar biosynthesis chaperone FliJ
MSENQSREDMNFKEDNEMEENPKLLTSFGNQVKFQPVKTRIRQLEKDMQELRSNINENKKAGMTIKSELIVLETTIKEKCNELCKCIMEDLANFDKDLKRVIQNDRTETDFFKVQTNSLNDDKIKLQKETLSLQSRMRTCEIDIGVEPKS